MALASPCCRPSALASTAPLPSPPLLGRSGLLPTRRSRRRIGSSSIHSPNPPAGKTPYGLILSKLRHGGLADEDPSSPNSGVTEAFGNASKHAAKIALAAAVASVLILSPVEDAMAAKSGGRVGGQAFRTAPPPPRAGPRIDNSRRTNIYVNPPTFVAPPVFGNPYYGGYGWSPFSFFFPGPSVAIGVGGGGFSFFSFFVFMIIASSIFSFFRRRNNDDDDDGGDYY